jgi:hypothetical protein
MDNSRKNGENFSLLEMSVQDENGFKKVIFMGRLLVDYYCEPSSRHPKGSRYIVAQTPTNSYFVFFEECSEPGIRRYEIYHSYDWMKESKEVPKAILLGIISALNVESNEDNRTFVGSE